MSGSLMMFVHFVCDLDGVCEEIENRVLIKAAVEISVNLRVISKTTGNYLK